MNYFSIIIYLHVCKLQSFVKKIKKKYFGPSIEQLELRVWRDLLKIEEEARVVISILGALKIVFSRSVFLKNVVRRITYQMFLQNILKVIF